MNIYTLDGIDYQITDIINLGDTKYVYFGGVNDPKNFCIRRLEDKEGEKHFVALDSEMEFNKALKLFEDKYQDLIA